MTKTLPNCPLIAEEDRDPNAPASSNATPEAWHDGLDSLLEELKYEEGLPFQDPEEIWEEVCYILEEEELVLSPAQKDSIRQIFDQVWPAYQGK